MENNKKRSAENPPQIEDDRLEQAAGGGHITYLVCSVCGREVPYSRYSYEIRINKCPYCNGKIVAWR